MKRSARWAVLFLFGALLGLGAFAPASAFALDGQCGSYQLPDGIRAQLFGKADCMGGQVAVGTSGDADRADFKAFASVDGRTVDFDDRANTLALRGGNCVRLFLGANYTGDSSGLLCTQTNRGFALGGFADRASSMRVCAFERQANCNANGGNGGDTPPTAPTPTPTPTPTPSPTPGPNPDPGSGQPVSAPDGESDYSLPPGADGRAATPGCVTSANAGVLTSASECFTQSRNVYTSKTKTRINGVDITPGPGGSVSVNTKTFRIRSAGPVAMKVGPITLKSTTLDWTLTQSIDVQTEGNPVLAKLPVQGALKLTATPGAVLVDVTVMLKPLDGVSGQTRFTAGMNGFDLLGVKVTAGEVNLGGLRIQNVELTYTKDSAGYRYTGAGSVQLPGKAGEFTGQVGFGSGGYFAFGGSIDGLNRPLANGVFLQRIGINFSVNPVGVGGSIGMSAGPQVTLLGKKFEAASIDGAFRYDGAGSGTFSISGNTKLVGYQLAEAAIKYQFDGKLDFSGGLDLTIKGNGMKGSITGWVDGATAFNAQGNVGVQVVGIGFGAGDGILSSRGVAACRRGFGPDFGFGYSYGSALPNVVFKSCGIGDYVEQRVSRSRAAGAPTGPVVKTFGIGKATDVAAFAVLGSETPPQVIVSDPDGRQLAVSPADPAAVIDDGKVTLFRDAEAKTTYVLVKAPTAGAYKLALATGSGPATAFRSAVTLPAPSVSARVRGKGRSRVLSFRVQRREGQVVRFYEQGRDTRRFIAASSKKAGLSRFAVPDGRPGRRDIVAIVEQDGVPVATGNVASYNAPPPQLPGRPSKVRLAAQGGNFVLTWRGAKRAASYEVRVYLGDGRRLAFYPSRSQRSIVIPNAPRGLRGNATVRGLTATNRRGPRGRDSVRVT